MTIHRTQLTLGTARRINDEGEEILEKNLEELAAREVFINEEIEKEGVFGGIFDFVPKTMSEKFYVFTFYVSAMCFSMSWQFAQFTVRKLSSNLTKFSY